MRHGNRKFRPRPGPGSRHSPGGARHATTRAARATTSRVLVIGSSPVLVRARTTPRALASREQPRTPATARLLRLLLFLALALTTQFIFPPTATFPHPSPSPDADSPECRGTLVSALRVYSKASSSAENGRHDVAVDLCTEVRPDPLTPVDYTKACSDISVNRINARDPFLAFSAVGAIRPPPPFRTPPPLAHALTTRDSTPARRRSPSRSSRGTRRTSP